MGASGPAQAGTPNPYPLRFILDHVILSAVRKLSDNPVFRLLLAQKRRARSTWFLTLVPVIGLVLFVLMAPKYEDAGRTTFPIGLAFFGVIFWAYTFHSFFLLNNLREPLRYSIKTGVADQFILTGISPLTRIAGILSMQAVELLHVTAVYLPLFLICRLLGEVTFAMIFAAVWVCWLLLLTVCLFELLVERRPGVAVAVVGFIAIILILPVTLLKGRQETAPIMAFLTPFLTLHPLILIFSFTAISLPIFELSREVPLMAIVAGGILPLLPAFTVMTFALNWIMLAGIVTGRHPLRSELFTEDKPLKGHTRVPLLSLFMPGPSQPPVRTLPTGLALHLCEENSTLRLPRLWEFATGLSVTVLVAVGAMLYLLPVVAIWMEINFQIPAEIQEWITGILFIILPWLALIGLIGAGACVSAKRLCRTASGRQLWPVLAGLGLLRGLLLTAGAYWFAQDFLNLTPSLARLWAAVIAAASLLALLLALAATLTADPFPNACLRCGQWLLPWLGLAGLELVLLLPIEPLVQGNRLGFLQATAAMLPFDIQSCLHRFFIGSLLLMLLLATLIVLRWRRITQVKQGT